MAKMKGTETNCPNCGCPIDPLGIRCLHCGTTYFPEVSTLDLENEHVMIMRMKYRDQIMLCKAYITGVSMNTSVLGFGEENIEMQMDFCLAPLNQGKTLMYVKRSEG